LVKQWLKEKGGSVYGSPTQFLLSISRSLTLSFKLPVSLGKRESKGKNGKEGEQRRKKKEGDEEKLQKFERAFWFAKRVTGASICRITNGLDATRCSEING
jgi:hypothetical protein